MTLSKMQFALLVSWISGRERGPMDSYEIGELDRMTFVEPPSVRVEPFDKGR